MPSETFSTILLVISYSRLEQYHRKAIVCGGSDTRCNYMSELFWR